jgi:hypothetical protein
MITIERFIITEEYALQCNVSIESLILKKEQQGFREVNRYTHPVAGLVVVLTDAPVPDYCLL